MTKVMKATILLFMTGLCTGPLFAQQKKRSFEAHAQQFADRSGAVE